MGPARPKRLGGRVMSQSLNTRKGEEQFLKTNALWILASIFGAIAVLLGQTNHIILSIWFGCISAGLLLIALFVHRSENKKSIAKPDLKIKLIPTPSFCSSFDSVLPNEITRIHRTAIILYLKITNTGNTPTEIGRIHVGYESMEESWCWLSEETTLLDDFVMPMGEKVKVFPFLKQKNNLMTNDTDTFLNPGQSRNGIVYFEQKASSGYRYPKIDENFKVNIQIVVHDNQGQKWSIQEKITKVMIDAAREHCPLFGKTRLVAGGDCP